MAKSAEVISKTKSIRRREQLKLKLFLSPFTSPWWQRLCKASWPLPTLQANKIFLSMNINPGPLLRLSRVMTLNISGPRLRRWDHCMGLGLLHTLAERRASTNQRTETEASANEKAAWWVSNIKACDSNVMLGAGYPMLDSVLQWALVAFPVTIQCRKKLLWKYETEYPTYVC